MYYKVQHLERRLMVNKEKEVFYRNIIEVTLKVFRGSLTEEDLKTIGDSSIQEAIQKAKTELECGEHDSIVELHNTANNLAEIYAGDTDVPKYIATMSYYSELPKTMVEDIEAVRKDGQ